MRQNIFKFLCAVIAGVLTYKATFLDDNVRLIVGVILSLSSLTLLILSRRQLGKSFSRKAEAKTLVTAGLYSKIRHPLYMFVDLLLLGLIIIFDIPIVLALWCILVVVQLAQSGREENILAKAFGEDYTNYKVRTWF